MDYPLGVRQSARIAFPDSCVGRTEKQGGEGEDKPQSTLYSPQPVRKAEDIPPPAAQNSSPGCRNCPPSQTCPNTFLLETPGPQQIHAYTHILPKHKGCQLIFPSCYFIFLPVTSFRPLSISLLPRDANAHAPACSLLLDVSNFADSRTGLCQQCLGHNVAELEAEKEVDTRVHADAEENDEKRESFEDLPEHLRLGTEFTLRVTVLQVPSSPKKGFSPSFQAR